MYLFRSDHKLADIIFRDPAAITVVNRFGISLGVGSATVEETCTRLGIDTRFFLTILNTSLNEDYFPEQTLRLFDISLITDYLLETDRYYVRLQLPNISRHLDSLARCSGREGNLELLRSFYAGMSDEITRLALGELERHECVDADWHSAEERLADLLSFFVIHLRGDYDRNLCVAVVTALFTLEKDLRQTVRIRRRILRPILSSSGL